ncbi:MAG: F0F1 ATP synthase subunit A [Bacteroidota bacterium]
MTVRSTFAARWIALFALMLGITVPAFAAGDGADGDPDAVGHSADGFYLDFNPVAKVELPRIFLTREDGGGFGFDVYGSTTAAVKSGNYQMVSGAGEVLTPEQSAYVVKEKKAYYYPLQASSGEIVLDLSFSRQMVFMLIAALVLLIVGLRLASRYQKHGRETAPKGKWQNFMEVMVTFVRDEIAKPAIGDKADRFLPYLLTAFFFILLGNLFGLLPWGVTATSGIAITAALAGFTFVFTQLAGTKDYWAHIFNPPGIPTFVKVILVPVEILGLLTKPLALAFRLFGNMVSGHLVIVSLLGLIFIFGARMGDLVGYGVAPIALVLTVAIYMLKIAVSFIQAYVFTMLSAVFIGLASEEHDHHHDEHHDHAHSELNGAHNGVRNGTHSGDGVRAGREAEAIVAQA